MKQQMDGKPGSPHVLDDIKIIGRNSWNECLRKWHSSMSFEDRMSWLHTNYHRYANGPEQFLFYLDIADRHGEGTKEFEKRSYDKEGIMAAGTYAIRAELKSRLSSKAFSILCSEFFVSNRSDRDNQSQFPIMLPYQEPLFSKLLWFFRPYGGYGGYDNLRPGKTDYLGKDGGKHYQQVANEFAVRFILNAWNILNSRWYHGGNPNDRPKASMAKPYWEEIVNLIYHLRLVDTLGTNQYIPRPWVFKKMVRKFVQENHIECPDDYIEHSAHLDNLGHILKPLAIKGGSVAKYLYITRLSVYDPSQDAQAYFILE